MNEVLWHDHTGEVRPASPTLDRDARADVVIIGGGVAGLMCAHALASKGRDVVLLEANQCGAGASGRSSGFVTPDSEAGLAVLAGSLGDAGAQELWRFVIGGVDELREVIHAHALDCDHEVQRSLLVASSRRAMAAVRDEYDAHRRLGFEARLLTREEVPGLLGTEVFHGGLTYGGTFAMNPYAFCQGLRAVLVARGVRIFESTRVTTVAPRFVGTAAGPSVEAETVVVCADRFEPGLELLKDEVYALQTFLLATTPLSKEDRHRVFPTGPLLVWDTDLVYHYLRATGDGRLLLGGGDLASTYSESDLGSIVRVKRNLEAHFRRQFPEVKFEVEYGWSGRLGVSKDLVPVLSRHEGVIVVGAATGLPWAAALGRLVADSVTTGRDGPWHWFAAGRAYPVSERLTHLLGPRLSFAVSHGLRKALGPTHPPAG